MVAVTLEVTACVVAWILSCKLLLRSDKIREEGEEEVEEEEYLTGESDPFIIDTSVEVMEGWADMDREG